MVWMRSNWARLAIAPWVVVSERGSPTTISSAARSAIDSISARQRAGHDHARRRAAGLAEIAEGGGDAQGNGAIEIGVRQDHVRRLAAELLRDALDRRRGGLGHRDAGAGGAGDRDHVDIRMRRETRPDAGAVAMDEVEDPGREAGFLDRLGEQQGAQRRELARLQHHRAACGERRRDLGGDLVERPVPRRDQRADTDRLVGDGGVAALLDEGEGRQDLAGDPHMGDRQRHLRGARIADRRAHLEGQALREQLAARLEQRLQAIEQTRAVFRLGPAPAGECPAGRRDGRVHVLAVSERKPGHDLFRRRIDHDALGGAPRLAPFAVDEEPVQAAVAGQVLERRGHVTRSFMR